LVRLSTRKVFFLSLVSSERGSRSSSLLEEKSSPRVHLQWYRCAMWPARKLRGFLKFSPGTSSIALACQIPRGALKDFFQFTASLVQDADNVLCSVVTSGASITNEMVLTGRLDPKSTSKCNYQEKRRREALERQEKERARALDTARQGRTKECRLAELAGSPPLPSGNEESGGSPDLSSTSHGVRDHWSSLFMRPEWMIEVPGDLGPAWFVMPRPEGQRCLVVSGKGSTIARLRNGVLFDQFQSNLPGGAREDTSGACSSSILDCIYDKVSRKYYVVDMLTWRGFDFCDCTAEFRLYWMHEKISETRLDAGKKAAVKDVFIALPAYKATPLGITAAYREFQCATTNFIQDGIYFIHSKSQYTHGQTPLAISWKDHECSRFPVDTDAGGTPLPIQMVTLRYEGPETRNVSTSDDPPVVLGVLPDRFVHDLGDKLVKGRLLRFSIGEGGIYYESGCPIGADLRFLGAAIRRGQRPDSFSRIAFQWLMRTSPITFAQLYAAAGVETTEKNGESGFLGSLGVVGQGSC
jgi:snurportin-1